MLFRSAGCISSAPLPVDVRPKRKRVRKRRSRARPSGVPAPSSSDRPGCMAATAASVTPVHHVPPCILGWSHQMTRAEDDLQYAVMVTVISDRSSVRVSEIAELLAPRLEMDASSLVLRRVSASNYILVLPDRDKVEELVGRWATLRAGSFSVVCKKWSRLMESKGALLPVLINLEIRGIPIHAWETSTVDHLLNPFAWIHHVHPDTLNLKDVAVFRCSAWCLDPSAIPSSKELWIVEPPFAVEGDPAEKRVLVYTVNIAVSITLRQDGSDSVLRSEDPDDEDHSPRRRRLFSPSHEFVQGLHVRGQRSERRSVHDRIGPRAGNGDQTNDCSKVLTDEAVLVEFSNVELREVDVDAQFQSHGPVVSSCAVSAECSSLQGGGQFSVHECPGSGQLIECPEELCQFGSQQGVGQISVLTGPGNGQLNGCLEDHNQIGCQQVCALAGNLGSVADCEVLLPRESPVAATSPPLLLRPKPIQVYFRRRRGARRVEETALGSSPSQPPASVVDVSTSRVSEFLSSITKEVDAVLENPAPNPLRKKKLPVGRVATPRRSRRVAGVGVDCHQRLSSIKKSKKTIMKTLGVIRDGDSLSQEALDEYSRIFSKTLSQVQIQALASLFGWSLPEETLVVEATS